MFMKLRQLIKNIPHLEVKGSKDIEITGIASHSERVAPGCLFIAKRGKSFDGNAFIPEALRSGAVAVLSDMFDPSLRTVTQLIAKDVEGVEGYLAAAFFDFPSKDVHVVGITGTSGKTTTSYLIRHLFSHCGRQSSLIGTVSYIIGERESSASRTTPDVITNQKFLKETVRAGIEVCVMEVSSHALSQGRVDHIDFDTAVFTNLTHEHLDYHKTMDAYAEAKSKLFSSLGKKKDSLAVFNAQDPFAECILKNASVRRVSFAIEEKADVVARNLEVSSHGTCFLLEWEGRAIPVEIPLMGRFNVQNALAAAAVFLARGYSVEDVALGMKTMAPPPGRLERIRNEHGLTIFVDYAHKEDALRKALITLRESNPERIIVVFGCGGDRDTQKRPKMGKVAEELADIVIVTSDNPRSENPQDIIDEICSGFSQKKHVVFFDRKEAIEHAISVAGKGDIVLIAGKGHEKEQIFARETVVFDDCEVARNACHNWGQAWRSGVC